MANNRRNTIFQNIGSVLFGTSVSPEIQKLPPTADYSGNNILYSTNKEVTTI